MKALLYINQIHIHKAIQEIIILILCRQLLAAKDGGAIVFLPM